MRSARVPAGMRMPLPFTDYALLPAVDPAAVPLGCMCGNCAPLSCCITSLPLHSNSYVPRPASLVALLPHPC